MKLLAVKETTSGYEGSSADLYLEINRGSGRVFLETFPLSKVDTQISTRYARDVACDYLDIDCNNYDFFYTINADSSIIGGPSAGAAIATLTVSMLSDADIDTSVAITGTINAGGIIGPIGGVRAKIDAAKSSGLKKVIIPVGERFAKMNDFLNTTNSTSNETNELFEIDLVEYGKAMGIEVIEVPELGEVLYIFTGQRFKKSYADVEIEPFYSKTMQGLSEELCNRSRRLYNTIGHKQDIFNNDTNATLSSAFDLLSRGEEAFNMSRYYSAGSYCFGANVRMSYIVLERQNLSDNSLRNVIDRLQSSIDKMNSNLGVIKVKTITDLESYMAVKERIVDAQELLDKAKSGIEHKERLSNIAFASERINSAIAWLSFFDNHGRMFNFNMKLLENSCRRKLAEVDEQFQYIGTLVPIDVSGIKKDIDSAYEEFGKQSFELCLFKASKSKAEINTLLSSISLDESQVENFINQKLSIIKRNIAEESSKGIFPILGYSYYEYADSLKENDKYSALLYSDYALEFSNLDMYFKDKQHIYLYNFDIRMILLLLFTALASFTFGVVLTARFYKSKKKKKGRKANL